MIEITCFFIGLAVGIVWTPFWQWFAYDSKTVESVYNFFNKEK